MGKTEVFASILDTIFPPLCFHCHEKTLFSHPLCSACLELLEPCSSLAVFEGEGPIWSLMKALKSGKAPHLAEGLAGYMSLHYLARHPLPDLIVPVPQSVFRHLAVGYNPALLLAEHLGKILERPVISLLQRPWQQFCQMKIDAGHRQRLSAHTFRWKKKVPIVGKTILLVDDVIGTGATLRSCAQRLYEGMPLKIIKLACVQALGIGASR